VRDSKAGSGVCVKQALPYVRLVGESWPLPLSRALYESEALCEEFRIAPEYVPELFFFDEQYFANVMQLLSPHIVLRKGMIQGIRYPLFASHMGKFLAKTLFFTSDWALSGEAKKKRVAFFCGTSLCKITEDLVFTDPYRDAPLNHWTSPQLDGVAIAFRSDSEAKLKALELKRLFMTSAEALIHGDLHTGSIMVTEDDTRVIDSEFAFYGPMGFDVGSLIAHLLISFCAHHDDNKSAFKEWILEQIVILWDTFASTFKELGCSVTSASGELYPSTLSDSERTVAVERYVARVFLETVGFCAVEMIRRIFGLAHVEDFDGIQNVDERAKCERRALRIARVLLVEGEKRCRGIHDVVRVARDLYDA